jgi:hypothetical protein
MNLVCLLFAVAAHAYDDHQQRQNEHSNDYDNDESICGVEE